jgi:hypothetical protein
MSLVVAAACDDTGLYPATFANYVDTVTLYALSGTPISTPSAFDIALAVTARTDEGDAFDFAFDIDSLGTVKILPAGSLGLTAQAGLQMSDKSFEEVDEAPYDKYVVDSALTMSVGDVFIGRSRNTSNNCYYLGSLPRYGKFHVLRLDTANRTVVLETLVNVNCGYRKLEPGFPTS